MAECITLDLQPRCVNIQLTRGDSPVFEFALEAPAGTPIDLTGTTLTLTVNASEDGSGTDLFALSPTNVLGVSGLAQFQPSSTETDLADGTYYYDLEWTAGSSVRTIVRGEWVIGPGITG